MNEKLRFWAPLLVCAFAGQPMVYPAEASVVHEDKIVADAKVQAEKLAMEVPVYVVPADKRFANVDMPREMFVPAPIVEAKPDIVLPADMLHKLATRFRYFEKRSRASLAHAFAFNEEACLTEVIYNEAAGQPYEGQVAVALTTMNRKTAGKVGGFADTICGVVNQKARNKYTGKVTCAYTYVCTGKHPVDNPTRHEYFAEAKEIAHAALHNELSLPNFEGVVNYFATYCNEDSPHHMHKVCPHAPTWADQMVRVAIIGQHEFYKIGNPSQTGNADNFYVINAML